MKKIVIILIVFLLPRLTKADIYNDSVNIKVVKCKDHRFDYKALFIPVALTAVGVIGTESHWLKSVNKDVREEVLEHIDNKVTVDDFMQYASVAAIYGFNAFGMKGKHNFRDRTTILAISYLIMSSSVTIMKNTLRVVRPDGSSNNSFPSGHTATAFMGAEMLFKEYAEIFPWIGIGGYAAALGVGLFRMYNNRHWLTDVVAGAGVGILSTKIAYWLYPSISRIMFKRKYHHSVMVLPYYRSSSNFGLSAQISF